MNIILAVDKFGLRYNILVQRNSRFDAFDDKFFQRAPQSHQGCIAGFAADNQFGNHTVVKRRNAVAGINFRVNANAQAARSVPFGNFTGAGSESFRVFGVDSAFNCVAAESDVVLGISQSGTAGNADLLANDVNAGNGFGNRMLNLQAGVHFHKIETAVFKQKFQRSGVGVSDFLNSLADDFADFFPLLTV